MDVFRLGPEGSNNYVPDELIEGYSSMIWTERFDVPGEFQLKTPLVKETLNLLPWDTLISHADTAEVMMVETHTIDEDEDGNDILTVTGRDLQSFLGHRWVEAPYQKRREMARVYTPTAAVAVLLVNAFDNASGNDLTRNDADYPWTTLDKLPNISITDSVAVDSAVRRWWLKEGHLSEQMLTAMLKGDLGIRCIRPSGGSTGKVISVQVNPLEDRGTVTRTNVDGITSLRFDIYQGLDRTSGQSANTKVRFSTFKDDVVTAQYLFSKKEFKTIAEVISSVVIPDVGRNATEKALSGYKRRVMSFDAGEPDIPAAPEKPAELRKNATNSERNDHADAMDEWIDDHAAWENKRDNIIERFKEDAADDALIELKKLIHIKLFAGAISIDTPYRYKIDYDLGDQVDFYGDYNQTERMWVSEYIRTEDSEGDRGYPTLAHIHG